MSLGITQTTCELKLSQQLLEKIGFNSARSLITKQLFAWSFIQSSKRGESILRLGKTPTKICFYISREEWITAKYELFFTIKIY